MTAEEEQRLLFLILALIPSVVPKDREVDEVEAGFMMRNTVKMARALLACDVKLPA